MRNKIISFIEFMLATIIMAAQIGSLLSSYRPDAVSLLIFSFIVYVAFVFVDVVWTPIYYGRKAWKKLILGWVGAYGFVVASVAILNFYSADYPFNMVSKIFTTIMPVALAFTALLAAYNTLKYLILDKFIPYTLENGTMQKMLREFLLITTVYVLGFFILSGRGYRIAQELWATIIPVCGLLYLINHYLLLPFKEGKKHNEFKYYALLAISFVLLFMIFMATFSRNYDDAYILILQVCVPILFIGLSIFHYERNKQHYLQVQKLNTKLGHSNASLDLLRNQINPHFLFNSLNTLYGTALQENADRTATGVQRLGDMMRFMLEENLQDFIPMSSEVEYMKNYIHLQTLRVQTSDKVHITSKIEDINCNHLVAPMLLIPFIENAFKHGISLREKSWVNISLYCDDHHIYFDVNNSVHARHSEDTERYNTGIGLNNVKQRLELLYPGKHELSIRQGTQEYFVHLTLTV
ncbi:histidine kinase [Chitinophaga skermanii]|uniref:Histidine kinase n=1 Tax=Chitinophaga skermanii TaxID=331697 RepID=A0A327R330_9BACT|nr:histidine kinase [Chitinophaga skermanii]RAJ11120.1 histidine kinase [Chitinophaga skermanii]